MLYAKLGDEWRLHSETVGFAAAVAAESDLVNCDKVLVLSDDLLVYVSDDRDVFYAMGRRDTLLNLIGRLREAGQETTTARYLRSGMVPNSVVGDYFEHWRSLNVEITG